MRQPLLMMRTKGLLGRVMGIYAGHRSSHPLAKSQGTSYSMSFDPRIPRTFYLIADDGDQLTDDAGNLLIR